MNDRDKIELMKLLKEWGCLESFIFDALLEIEKGKQLAEAITWAVKHPEDSQWGRSSKNE